MTIKAIIFDLEGVLMKTRDSDLYTSVANALDLPYEMVKEVFFSDMNDEADLGKYTQEQFEENVIHMLGLPIEKLEILRRVHEEQTFLDQVMIDLIQSLKQNYKIGLLSNYTMGMRERIEKDWKIGDLFDTIIISSEVGVIKPDPAIYQLILDRLDVLPRESVLIDDRIKNIHGADAFGMHTIYYLDRNQTLADLNKLLASA